MHLLLVSLLSLATLFVSAAPQTEWKTYTSTEGKFSAVMPAATSTSVIVTDIGKGPVHTKTVSSQDEELNEYLVSWTKYELSVDHKATEKTYDRVRDALIWHKGGRLVSESSITMKGRPARAVTFTDSDGRTIKVRFYFVDERFYQVMASESRGKPHSADLDRFLDSFAVSGG